MEKKINQSNDLERNLYYCFTESQYRDECVVALSKEEAYSLMDNPCSISDQHIENINFEKDKYNLDYSKSYNIDDKLGLKVGIYFYITGITEENNGINNISQ